MFAAGAQPSASASKLARALGDSLPPTPEISASKPVERLGYLRQQRDELLPTIHQYANPTRPPS